MQIFDKSENKIYKKFDYDVSGNCFYILDDDGNVVSDIFPIIQLDSEYKPSKFELKILYNERNDCTEESIFQVYAEKIRIGWIFPIQAINSKEHSHASDKYFLKYAYIAWYLLLDYLDINIESMDEFDLFQQYNDGINLLILDKDNCNQLKNFEFDKYVVIGEYDIEKINNREIKYKNSYKIGKKIKGFDQLQVGDYVVHTIHGIGQYQGVISLTKNGVVKDYHQIIYADNDKIYVPASKIETIDKYVIGLYQKGYSVKGKGNLFVDAIDKNIRLNIQRQSNELDDIPYLIELFKRQIPLETNDISRFYLYYQVIEILISKVFDKEFSNFIEELKDTTEKLFDKKEELGHMSNEKWRVRKLCNEYCSLDTYLKQCLNDKCKDILNYTNCKIYDNMEDNLYQVRCLMVHRMYILDENAEEILHNLNNIFLEVIIQLVLSYCTK